MSRTISEALGWAIGLLLGIGILAAFATAAAAPARQPHNEAVISWAVPAGYEASRAVGDPFLVTYQVQAAAPGPLVWVTLGTVTQNWYRATGLTPGRWSFRVQVLVDGTPLGQPSAAASRTIRPQPVAPQPRRPQAEPLAVAVECDCEDVPQVPEKAAAKASR